MIAQLAGMINSITPCADRLPAFCLLFSLFWVERPLLRGSAMRSLSTAHRQAILLVALVLGACSPTEGEITATPTGPGGSGGGGAGEPATTGAGASSASAGAGGVGSGGTDPGGGAGAGGGQGGQDCGPEISGEGAPLASLGPCGKLTYHTYESLGSNEPVHRLPDFSYAGYEGGGVAIPDVPVVVEVSPVSGDDRASIQAAIDAASALPLGADGFRGAVLLHKGEYQVADTLTIEADGVVLRGEGQNENGTVLIATSAKQYTLIDVLGTGSSFGEAPGTRQAITSALAPVGARSFDVEDGAVFSPGDTVIVERTPNQAWIDDLGMGPYGWTADSYRVGHERTVVTVNGNTITVDIPLVDSIEDKYGGGEVYRAEPKGRRRHVGVEDLRMGSLYSSPTDEDHGWTAVRFSRAEDSWARRLTVLHFGYSAATLADHSRRCTVEEVAHLDPISEVTGGRRYSFYVDKGTSNLFQRCYSRDSRHSFVTGARVAGPNVWLDCLAEDTNADDGPHHRWATGLLFDNVKAGSLKVQNRQDSGSGHGWSGAQVLFWNGQADEIICDAPKGAMNWAIGNVGAKSEGNWAPGEPFGWWESEGTAAAVRSLYLQQLEDRLGKNAVLAITVEAQRTGRIWDALSSWSGNGALSEFL